MPLIENRKPGAAIITVLYVILPITFVIFAPDYPLSPLIIGVILGGFIIPIGAFVYLGFIELLAGFAPKTGGSSSEYDLNRVSSFMGISMALIALISFFNMLIVLIGTDDYTMTNWVYFLSVAIMFTFVALYSKGKRFMNENSEVTGEFKPDQ